MGCLGSSILSIKRTISGSRLSDTGKKCIEGRPESVYYISIYFWLFIMYVSDKTSLEAHSLVGGGILGMAVIFLLCWLGVKAFGMKNA